MEAIKKDKLDMLAFDNWGPNSSLTPGFNQRNDNFTITNTEVLNMTDEAMLNYFDGRNIKTHQASKLYNLISSVSNWFNGLRTPELAIS